MAVRVRANGIFRGTGVLFFVLGLVLGWVYFVYGLLRFGVVKWVLSFCFDMFVLFGY